MKNDTSAILVGIEKLETSLEGFTGTSAGSAANSDSSIATTLEAVHALVNETRQSQLELGDTVREGIQSIQRGIELGAMNVTDTLEERITTFESKMSESQKLIQDQVTNKLAILSHNSFQC